MSVWFAIPSAKSPQDWSTISEWRERGYKVAVFRDAGAEELPGVDLQVFGEYCGYAAAVNQLSRLILLDPKVQWIVTGGDDISPDPNRTPEEIATECAMHFYSNQASSRELRLASETFGVMQPTGDKWMVHNGLTATERVCESPWMGREWCERAYGGLGPLWEGYRHFFVDEDLHNVAQQLGVLWHRKDLIQYHHHWSRNGPHRRTRPEYLTEAKLGWVDGKTLFESRKLNNFPGHEPLAA